MIDESELTEHQKVMLDVWHRHGHAEFGTRDPDAAIATMNDNPYIWAGGIGQLTVGRDAVHQFYSNDMCPNVPDDIALQPVGTIISKNRIIDEFIFTFTHSIDMPWLLPSVAPTGRKVEMAMCVMVGFEGDRISFEHLWWDQGGLLRQIGVIDHPALAHGASAVPDLRQLIAADKV
ncbi:nuclear transport factor 2 family protein [Sphingobium fluviale]|uniref:SnoaL-like domain-containing protein n=1 Tax=Sphingobium fluviale TaxID=2506423 RepID=A0A4Q1KCU0_9SPHN|nr:nuclear transport factor 2 family protein [Sphingobium fluviale]RXR24725.1 hypothetical protein EQG66_14945 [Sphingobium fluviale]